MIAIMCFCTFHFVSKTLTYVSPYFLTWNYNFIIIVVLSINIKRSSVLIVYAIYYQQRALK